jgi:hypothetical protein
LLAGIDLLSGKVHALVRDRHRSREFIEFLKLLDAAYPVHTAIKLILDNPSAHISKETRAWIASHREAGCWSCHIIALKKTRLVSNRERLTTDDAVESDGVAGLELMGNSVDSSACEGIVKLRLGTGVAVIAILSAVGSSLAVDRPRERGTQSRLPKASTASDRHGDVLSSRAKVRDDHVSEFLRWKDRLRATARVPSGD